MGLSVYICCNLCWVQVLAMTSRGCLFLYLGGLSRHHVIKFILEVLVSMWDFWWLVSSALLVVDGFVVFVC